MKLPLHERKATGEQSIRFVQSSFSGKTQMAIIHQDEAQKDTTEMAFDHLYENDVITFFIHQRMETSAP